MGSAGTMTEYWRPIVAGRALVSAPISATCARHFTRPTLSLHAVRHVQTGYVWRLF